MTTARRPAARCAVLLSIFLAGSAPVSAARAQDSTLALAEDIPPEGFGTLRQEDIALRLQSEDLQVRILPLDERVIRLLSPDSYRAMRGLKDLKAAEIGDAAQRYGLPEPTLFAVTFFGLRERATFIPEDVTITSRGRFFRPVAIIPLSPRWAEQQLTQRETAFAVYLYDGDIAVLEPFEVAYRGIRVAGWERIIPVLDQERAAVIARAAAGGGQ